MEMVGAPGVEPGYRPYKDRALTVELRAAERGRRRYSGEGCPREMQDSYADENHREIVSLYSNIGKSACRDIPIRDFDYLLDLTSEMHVARPRFGNQAADVQSADRTRPRNHYNHASPFAER